MIKDLLIGGSCFCFGISITMFWVRKYIFPQLHLKGLTVSKWQDGEEELHWLHIKRRDGQKAIILLEDLNINWNDKDIISDWADETIQDGIYIRGEK